MNEKRNFSKIIGLLYKKQALNKQELTDIERYLSSHENLDELNSYIDSVHKNSSSDIKLKVETIWDEIKRRKSTIVTFKSTISIIQKYAAILLLTLFVYSSWITYQYYLTPEEYFTIATNKGEQTNIILPDGSSAWLNVDTRISYNTLYGKSKRELIVSGEAFFKVKKNAAKPFVVHIQNMEVKALGTAFNVRGFDDDIMVQTSLFEGKVDVKMNKSDGDLHHQILLPGQSLVFNRERDTANLKKFNQETVGAWKDKQLIFENAPFDDVIKNTERWFNVEINYNPDKFKNDYLTLRLKKGGVLRNLLEIIDETIGVNYIIQNNKIILTKK